MTVEIAVVISLLSLIFAFYQGISNLKRNSKIDTEKDASSLTTVIVKLENISKDLSEIKNDLKDVRKDLKDHSDRLAKLEAQIKIINKAVFDGIKTNE